MKITIWERSLYCELWERKTLDNAVKIDFESHINNSVHYAVIITETGEKTLVNVKDIISVEQ